MRTNGMSSSRVKTRRWIAALGLLALLGSSAVAQSSFEAERGKLRKALVVGRMRFFYATTGFHAVNPTDRNGNGVPDQVDDVAAQIVGAWLLLVDGLDFPDPFKSGRYRDVKWLDVHFLNRRLLNWNGKAYDEKHQFKHPGDPEPAWSLCIDIATSVNATRSLTPAHEVFHIIQNGASFFKTPWYLEGMARWSENSLGRRGFGWLPRAPQWPLSQQDLAKAFASSYDACSCYWEPMIRAVDPDGEIPPESIPADLKRLRYLNGAPVLGDLAFPGWRVVRRILLELGRADDVAFKEMGLDQWAEWDQRSNANTPYIHRTVLMVASQFQHGP